MPILSKKKLRAQMLQQYAIDRHVLSEMHELLRKHLEATGKFTAAERTAWERDVMVPALARQGIDVVPRIYVEAPPKPLLVGIDGGIAGTATKIVRSDFQHEPKGITVEPTQINPTAFGFQQH